MDNRNSFLYRTSGVELSFEAARSGALSRHDFVDITLTRIEVEVAGGGECILCEKTLGWLKPPGTQHCLVLCCVGCRKFIGEPTMQYRLVGCAVSPIPLENGDELSDVRKGYNVPAHNIEIRVTEVADHDHATLVRLTGRLLPFFSYLCPDTLCWKGVYELPYLQGPIKCQCS